MKTTEEIISEIIKSIVEPVVNCISDKRGTQVSVDDVMKSLSDESLKSLELYDFVNFVKHYVTAIKIAYRLPADKRPFYEMIGMFLEQLERIGNYNDRRYDERMNDFINEHREYICGMNPDHSIDLKIERVFELAGEFVELVEFDYARRKQEIMEKRRKLLEKRGNQRSF